MSRWVSWEATTGQHPTLAIHSRKATLTDNEVERLVLLLRASQEIIHVIGVSSCISGLDIVKDRPGVNLFCADVDFTNDSGIQ